MYYICFGSRKDSTTKPAHRWMEFIAESKKEFDINLALARKGKQNINYECVKIRHDGAFHLDVVKLPEL